jgi:acyl-CoA thioesterase YciA
MSDRPKGELVIQTIAMPKDTNANGDIFGGWVTSQMDLGSGILAAKTAQARVVTAAMEGMSFLEPGEWGTRSAVLHEWRKSGGLR